MLVPALAATLFASAFLLFWCQPMVGKMVLPLLGGAASVWTTCVLFFQAMLLAGYIYAHLLGRIADVRKQILTHLLVLLTPLVFLPIEFRGATPDFQNPIGWLLLQLLATAGVPFFVISTTAPLLQNWLARTKDASARDPYFLYSASNTGSLLALVAYPFFLEPRLGVTTQSLLWVAGYVVLLGIIAVVSAIIWSTVGAVSDRPGGQRPPLQLKWSTRFYWVAAAFVPSGLMLAVTNHITANLASAPFLWIVPLAVYLLTFILAFARRFRVSPERISRLIPVVLLGIFPLVTAGVIAPPGLNWIVIALHVVLLYCGALLCHTALAARRPDPRYLTEFYFWIALAGVLGGVFTAIIAPLIFRTVLEYPLLVAVVPFFRTGKKPEGAAWLPPVILAAAILAAWLVFRVTEVDKDVEVLALVHTALVFVCYKFKNHVPRFALAFAVVVVAYTLVLPDYIEGANRLFVDRNFFGVKKVLEDPATRLRKLLHGDTTHGIESTDPMDAGKPLSYYHATGPVGDVMEMVRGRVGVIGLGSGTMAAYGGTSRHVTFYEIDPDVEPIARRFFTFLSRCAANCEVVIGDGRLQLSRAANGAFDLLMLDAFSSDAIPTHLLSSEALKLYLSKLAPNGVLLFHVSNRYLNVERLVSALVTDAGLAAFSRFDEAGDLRKEGKTNSNHVIAARRIEDLGPIPSYSTWKRVARSADFQSWTDDYSNLPALIRWH